ncbi:NCS2 family permease [Marinobacter persicus]|uniref:AGZA family xanthine/uracil permease-like MFS transporter n=1 Tax=Marinobacter persicus TaxID=930118 RepID=A0A2S6G9X8_9GAMM|nr:NCS2 family permease [Marinobacter persicus]PPK53048.1 AGZA family xanthine/uracil permease-like MFS transporter [Marinobacter persicus]PPK55925.1 AGZA family xanthine/uracil permease-like MFS transporter [Marinobacter persicus]
MLERLFQLEAHGTTVRKEIVAGITTFLTMAYIIVVNPSILSATGMDFGAVFVATCIAAAIGTLIMGLWANYPIALAPGMGLNAFFSFTVVGSMGYSWQVALGAVFLSGFIFFILSVVKIREWIINSIPMSLRFGISAGIGFFLGFIALKNAGIVVDNPATLVSMGEIKMAESLLFFGGFVLICALSFRRITGAVMIGILAITAVAMMMGMVEYDGLVSAPPSLAPTFMQLDIAGALNVGMISVVFAFLFVDLFDTSGTLIGAAQRGGLLDKDGKLPRLGRALMSDSVATMSGAALGTSTTTSYIESTAGISAGGRTGLTAAVVAVLFLACLVLSPIASIIPPYATAPALFYVAVLMASGLKLVDWDDITDAAPAIVTALTMPLTFSIANGIALGFITYAVIKALAGRWSDLNASVVTIAVVFVLKFMFLEVA